MVQRFKFLFGDERGLYGVKDTGQLLWWPRSAIENGSLKVSEGTQIGSGWADFTHVFAGGFDGSGCILYAIDSAGRLLWYRDQGPCMGGTAPAWANSGTSIPVGSGLVNKLHVAADFTGAIYAIAADGTLEYYRHPGRDPGQGLDGSSVPTAIGAGWQDFPSFLLGGVVGQT